jgi:hypoxanthine phosphoribosyltransferase
MNFVLNINYGMNRRIELLGDIERVLITGEQIKKKIKQLGKKISNDYKDSDNLLLVGVLKGAVLFMSDLIRYIDIPLQIDFMAVSSYGSSTESSGVVRILKDLDETVEGKDVLVVEDIIDSGLTLDYMCNILSSRKPASLKICALLDKPSRRKVDLEVDYLGFEIPDYFVVGYGLDYAGKYRNLPYICILKPEIYLNQ